MSDCVECVGSAVKPAESHRVGAAGSSCDVKDWAGREQKVQREKQQRQQADADRDDAVRAHAPCPQIIKDLQSAHPLPLLFPPHLFSPFSRALSPNPSSETSAFPSLRSPPIPPASFAASYDALVQLRQQLLHRGLAVRSCVIAADSV